MLSADSVWQPALIPNGVFDIRGFYKGHHEQLFPVKTESNKKGFRCPKTNRKFPKNGADGGGRTHTLVRVQDFESSASANSATSALIPLTPNPGDLNTLTAHPWRWQAFDEKLAKIPNH